MASIIKADTLQSTTANVSILNSSGTEYARFDSTGVFQLANPTTFPAGTAALPSITATGDTNTGIFFPAADTIAFSEGGVESMRIDSAGNVGIGTASPTQKLQVYTSAGSGGQIQVTNFATGATATDGVLIGYDGSNDVIINNQEATQLKLYTSGVLAASINAAGALSFNSGYGSVATAYGCRAWVNFNGQGTVAIRASGNVTSITDNGTGSYTVNITTAMPDANYSICGNVGNATSSDKVLMQTDQAAPTTSAFRIASTTTAGVINDNAYVWAAIFR